MLAPADTERVVLREYPALPCGLPEEPPRCDLITFMWNDGGSAIFFANTASRWRGALHYEMDERRGILYVPAGRGEEYRDSVAGYTLFAKLQHVRGASARRLHATLQTTDAFFPGFSPTPEPLRRGDMLLHASPGDSVVIETELQTRHDVNVVAAPALPAVQNASDGTLVTDSTVYHLRISPDLYSADIAFTYHNRTAAQQYLPWCGEIGLEKWTENGWRAAVYYACPAIGGVPPDTIAALTVHRDTFQLRSWSRPRTYPRFEVAPIPGVYRLRYRVYRTALGPATENLADPVPLPQAVSNPFEIRVPLVGFVTQ